MSNNIAPNHLSHKPIIVVNNYQAIDAAAQGYATDAEALSIGHAQYNNNDISAKIFRHTGEMWSRQSEEMPLHRVLDLTNLILEAMLICQGKENPAKATIANRESLNELKTHFESKTNLLESRLRQIRDSINQLGI